MNEQRSAVSCGVLDYSSASFSYFARPQTDADATCTAVADGRTLTRPSKVAFSLQTYRARPSTAVDRDRSVLTRGPSQKSI